MRKSLLFVWACMGLVCLMSACKTSVKSKEWKLVWVEDFDQKTVLTNRYGLRYLAEHPIGTTICLIMIHVMLCRMEI